VELTEHEIVIASNAINEICNGPDAIEEWEFGLRVGAPSLARSSDAHPPPLARVARFALAAR
jgi:hypothetical protein